MPSLKNMPSMKNMTTASWSNPLCIVVMLLVLLILVLAIFRSASPFLNLGFGVNAHIGELKGSIQLEAFNNHNEKPVLVMYYANWCGHCKRAKPEFQKLKDEYKGNVELIMIDCELDENKKLVESAKIEGFPTIRYYPSGMNEAYKEYTGERTYSNFVEYLGNVQGYPDVMPDNAAPVM